MTTAAVNRFTAMDKARAAIKAKSYCPYGCDVRQVDEKGYCRHLVGFCADGKTVELRERFRGTHERTGVLTRPLLGDDDIVETWPGHKHAPSGDNPAVGKGGQIAPSQTKRVYRKLGRAPVEENDTRYDRRPESRDYYNDIPEGDEFAPEVDESELEQLAARKTK